MEVDTCVVPAAGRGTRFYPLTKAQPKEMLPLVDIPVIHGVVSEAYDSGIRKFLIVVGRGKDAILDYFDKHPLDDKNGNGIGFEDASIYFTRQREQRGLADAVMCARQFTGDRPFLLSLGDTRYIVPRHAAPVPAQLIRRYDELRSPVVAVEKVRREKIRDYGIIDGRLLRKGVWRIDGLVEKPAPELAPSNIGMTGIYVLPPQIYDCIDRINPGVNGELQLTDALRLMLGERRLYGVEFVGRRYDIGTKELWVEAFLDFVKRDKRYREIWADAMLESVRGDRHLRSLVRKEFQKRGEDVRA